MNAIITQTTPATALINHVAVNSIRSTSTMSLSNFSRINHAFLLDLSQISDKNLFDLCREYGNNAKIWKRKFEELLPEVLKRRLYKKHGFVSIYEFAAKLCGLSHDSVDNVIRIYDQLKDKPILRSLVVEFGWSKLRIVSSIATKETDASWAEKVRVLPKDSLATFVRDLKRQEERRGIEKLISTGGITNNNLGNNETINFSPVNQISDNQNSIRPIFRAENLTEKSAIAINTISTCNLTGQDGQKQSSENQTQDLNPSKHTTSHINQYFNQSPLLIPTHDQLEYNSEHALQNIPFKLSSETHFRLRKLKTRIEKGKKEKISFDQLFEIMLDIIENKERIVKKTNNAGLMSPMKLCQA